MSRNTRFTPVRDLHKQMREVSVEVLARHAVDPAHTAAMAAHFGGSRDLMTVEKVREKHGAEAAAAFEEIRAGKDRLRRAILGK